MHRTEDGDGLEPDVEGEFEEDVRVLFDLGGHVRGRGTCKRAASIHRSVPRAGPSPEAEL